MPATALRNRRPPLIPLIHNYCDRWCSECVFAARCGVARMNEGKPRPDSVDEVFKQFAESFARLRRSLRRVARKFGIPQEVLDDPLPLPESRTVDLRSHRIIGAARTYSVDTIRWLRTYQALHPTSFVARENPDPRDPFDVIAHFSIFVGVKVNRAIRGTAGRNRPRDEIQTDSNGSAKAALLAIERSIEAWRRVGQAGAPEAHVAATFVERLEIIERELEAVFPNARLFRRPGFDPGWRRGLRELTGADQTAHDTEVPA